MVLANHTANFRSEELVLSRMKLSMLDHTGHPSG